MASYGYARVSTLDQNLTVQRQASRAAGCGVIRPEKASGSRRDKRTELQVLLDFVHLGRHPHRPSRAPQMPPDHPPGFCMLSLTWPRADGVRAGAHRRRFFS
jgi:hypothetical protein